ncbi:hypothetical protein DEO72_LG5g708 [Vigna unguiculata]|uniref:Uncharacterized protein n=1 Tax=Vigna unguiculata TaxID=3917 RepID=A0A4D6LW20_VIGUN|nr:hypothetical protein DEO72_LG5g708 [Vigna unguiculata]
MHAYNFLCLNSSHRHMVCDGHIHSSDYSTVLFSSVLFSGAAPAPLPSVPASSSTPPPPFPASSPLPPPSSLTPSSTSTLLALSPYPRRNCSIKFPTVTRLSLIPI